MSDQAAELDTMTDEEAIASLERKFQGWLVYRDGMDLLCHARHHENQAHIRGEDWVDLRDLLVRETSP